MRTRQLPYELTSTIDLVASILLDFAFVFGTTKRKPNESNTRWPVSFDRTADFVPHFHIMFEFNYILLKRGGPSMFVLLCPFLDAVNTVLIICNYAIMIYTGLFAYFSLEDGI